jgi:hypothetical protein
MTLHGPRRFATAATALLNLMRGYLVGYDRGLEVGQDRLGFGEREPERLRCERVPLNGGQSCRRSVAAVVVSRVVGHDQ